MSLLDWRERESERGDGKGRSEELMKKSKRGTEERMTGEKTRKRGH